LVALDWPTTIGSGAAATLLRDEGLTKAPVRMAIWLTMTSPFVNFESGPHLLSDAVTPWEIVRRLARLASRGRVRLLVPEGFNVFQVADRLEQHAVCSRAAFLAASRDPRLLASLGVHGASAEGYLFPATYDLFADSPAAEVLATMVKEEKRRFQALASKYSGSMQTLADRYDWSEHEVLTLASIVEKEAARPQEQPLVASVFFNRLESADFRPSKMLQSDPTAAYGCLLDPALSSCSGYAGRVIPSMLRDSANPYNTYRHPGLPPGPIASPGAHAIEAILNPAKTDYLFFFASGNLGHVFSRNLAEHEAAIAPSRNKASAPGSANP
jgi:UPF0755 protein